MKQEHKLVAEVYRYIAPFIDSDSEFYISLDGQAADNGVTQGIFIDSTIPDMWFTLVNKSKPVLIEAKTIDANNRMLLMQSQLKAWRTNGHGAHVPEYWIAVNRAFDEFYFWKQADFLQRLDATKAQGKTITVLPPIQKMSFRNAQQLALHILQTV